MRHVAIALLLACSACSSCRDERPANADAAPVASPSTTPIASASAPPRDVSGKMTKVAMPKGCFGAQIVTRDEGDIWMTAHCDGHDGVYRRGRGQIPPLGL